MDVLTAWMKCPIPLPKPGLELVSLCHGYPSGNRGLLGRRRGEYIQKKLTGSSSKDESYMGLRFSFNSDFKSLCKLKCVANNLLTLFPRLWEQRIGCYAMLLQSCLTLCDPVDCSLPGSSVHGILQARRLASFAMTFSRGSSRPRDRTHISFCLLHWQAVSLPLAPPGKPLKRSPHLQGSQNPGPNKAAVCAQVPVTPSTFLLCL